MIKERDVNKELTLELAEVLVDRLVEMEAEDLLEDRNALIELVYTEIRGRYDSMSLEEIREAAEDAGILEQLERVEEK
jgi:hypothetical protein